MKGEDLYGKLLLPVILHLKRLLLLPHYFDWRWWEKQKQMVFLFNICIGITIGISFYFITHLQFMENLFNTTIDKMVKKEAAEFSRMPEKCLKLSSQDRECSNMLRKFRNNIVFIDIDHETYEKWGEPLFIPRDKIAQFLELADSNKAKVVAFDTLFDYPSDKPHSDDELRRVLTGLTQRKSELKIIFPTIKSKIDNKIKRNIFDDLIDRNPNFYRGFPYSSFSKSDKVVRYIRYYDIAKGSDGGDLILWGVPVLSVALAVNNPSALKSLEPKIMEDYKHHRAQKYLVELSSSVKLEIANNELFSNRIRFALLPPGTLGGEGNLFAERILPDEAEALQQELKDKIVIIGTSSPDKEGWYDTPVGDMAGIYILGNVMNVLSGNWQVRDAPPWLSFSINFIVIMFASYMFVYFSPFVARTIATILAFALLIPLTYYFYLRYGIFINTIFLFINLVIPVVAMGWHGIIVTVRKLILTKLSLLKQYRLHK